MKMKIKYIVPTLNHKLSQKKKKLFESQKLIFYGQKNSKRTGKVNDCIKI